MISPFFRNDTVEIIVPNNRFHQRVAVEKSKNLLERCQRITPLDRQGGRKRRRVIAAAQGSGASSRHCCRCAWRIAGSTGWAASAGRCVMRSASVGPMAVGELQIELEKF